MTVPESAAYRTRTCISCCVLCVAGSWVGLTPPPAPQETWPLSGALDENGSLLIQEIGKVLIHGMAQAATLMPISQNKFDVMQRIASYGALTISGVLRGSFAADPSESLTSRKERFEPLIGAAYSWKTALDNLATAT